MQDAFSEVVRRMAQAMHEPLLILTPDLRVVLANAAFCRVFYVSPEAVEGRALAELGGWHGFPQSSGWPAQNTLEEFTVEYTPPYLVEATRSVQVRACQLSPSRLILCVFEDFSQREDSLRQSEERLRQVIQNMPVMLVAYDADKVNIIVWNHECERVTGYSADEIIGRPEAPVRLYPNRAYREHLRQLWQQVGDNYRGLEWDITCKDGSVRTISWSNIADRFPIPGWATWGIGVDITERKRAEESLRRMRDELEMRVQERTVELATANIELRKSEERLRQIVQNMPVMLIAFNAQANLIAAWNRECERVTGYRAEEVVGNPQAVQMLYPDRALRLRLLEEWRRLGDDYRDMEWPITCKDGTQRLISWSNISDRFPIPGWATWGVGVDVTERKRLEQQALDLALEREKVQLLRRFIGDASHDLRTPLTAQKTFLYVLDRLGEKLVGQIARLADPTVVTQPDLIDEVVRVAQMMRERINILTESSAHLNHMVEGMFDMIRLDSQITFDLALHDLNALAGSAVRTQQPLANDKNLRLVFQPGADLPLLLVDGDQFTRVIQNLLENAVRYTPAGGSVFIRTYRQGTWVVLEVQDTGIGIAQTDLPRIFDRFFRASNARMTYSGGTGLGLAIVQKTVEAHGGSVEVESEAGRGSTFRVLMPPASQVAPTA